MAIASSFPVKFGETATAFAHLTEYGTPTLTKYVNDARPAPAGKALVSVRHAAAFGDVNVLLRRGHARLYISGLENPDQEAASVAAGRWQVSIFPAGSWHPAFSATLDLQAGKAYFAYAVGTPEKGTFDVKLQTIDSAIDSAMGAR